MSSENKKISIKGSKTDMNIAICNVVFIVAAIAGIIIRIMQMASYIAPETGFYKGHGDWIHLIFYVILAVNIIFFCGRCYLSADVKKIEIGGDSHRLAGIGTRLFAVALLWDSFYSFFSCIYNAGTSASEYTSLMKSGVLPMLLQSFFAFLSAIYFFILASDFSKGTAKAYKRKILATAPVCWAGARLIFRFLRQISFVQVSDLLLELVMIAFMVMFFMALAQTASGVYVDNVKWRIPGFGLSAGLIAAVISVPRLIFTVFNNSLIVSEHPFSVVDFVFVIFIMTLMAKIKEDAQRPSISAEYEEKAE